MISAHLTMVDNVPWSNFHSFENRCNFFSRWKLLLVSASKFRQHFFCGKQVNVTEQITMLINCRTKTLKRARGVK